MGPVAIRVLVTWSSLKIATLPSFREQEFLKLEGFLTTFILPLSCMSKAYNYFRPGTHMKLAFSTKTGSLEGLIII